MKFRINCISLILLVLTTFICLSQVNDDLLIFEKKDKTLSENGFQLDSIIYQLFQNASQNWSTDEKISLYYDSIGNMVIRIISKTGKTAIPNKYSFYYNNLNQLFEWTHEYFVNNNWYKKFKYQISYDNENRGIDTIHQVWNDSLSKWENSWRVQLIYDDNNIIELLQFYWNNDLWSPIARNEYSYHNNLLSEDDYQEWKNNNWFSKFKYFYSYDNNENQTDVDIFKFSNNQWVWIEHNDHFFDSNNNLIRMELNEINEDNTMNLSFINEYFYNQNNKIITELHSQIMGNNPVYSSQYIYSYDEYENKAMTELFFWTDNSWKNYSRRIYYYGKTLDIMNCPQKNGH